MSAQRSTLLSIFQRALPLALVLLVPGISLAQSLEEAQKLYEEERYKPALLIIEKLEKARGFDSAKKTAKKPEAKKPDPKKPELSAEQKTEHAAIAGLRCDVELALGNFDNSIRCAEFAAELDSEVWSMYCESVKAQVAFLFGDDKTCGEIVSKLPKDAGWVKDELPVLMKAEGLTVITSKKKRYKVYVDAGLAAKKGEEFVGRVMDIVYDAYSKVFPFKKDKRIIYRVYAFSSTANYLAFNKALGEDASGSAGYFAPSTRILCIDADPRDAPINESGFGSDAINTMFHEGFHQFIHMFASSIPLWFDEGIAEYFGPSRLISKGSLNIGVVEKSHPSLETRYELLRDALTGRSSPAPLSMRAFMTNNEAFSAGEGRTELSYAQAWSIIHFLLHSKAMAADGKGLIKRYFDVLVDGGGPDKAFAETFGKLDLEKLQEAWRKYVLEEM